ncbi:hypothetical protein KCU88_g353, partial [Aureobasidium melanogenum]
MLANASMINSFSAQGPPARDHFFIAFSGFFSSNRHHFLHSRAAFEKTLLRSHAAGRLGAPEGRISPNGVDFAQPAKRPNEGGENVDPVSDGHESCGDDGVALRLCFCPQHRIDKLLAHLLLGQWQTAWAGGAGACGVVGVGETRPKKSKLAVVVLFMAQLMPLVALDLTPCHEAVLAIMNRTGMSSGLTFGNCGRGNGTRYPISLWGLRMQEVDQRRVIQDVDVDVDYMMHWHWQRIHVAAFQSDIGFGSFRHRRRGRGGGASSVVDGSSDVILPATPVSCCQW